MSKNKDIVKSNALIEATYQPGSVYRMRVLLACLTQIRAKGRLSHRQVFTVTADALSDLTGISVKSNYRELEKAAKDLMNLIITTPEYQPIGEDGKRLSPRYKQMNVVSSCVYCKGEGKLELQFTHDIIPYISSLKKCFTKYQARHVMPMRSAYGIRLYELCIQWIGDEREFTINEFRALFGVENKHHRIAKLKQWVIEPAIRDVNTYSNIKVNFGQVTAGRTITHFQFQIVRKKEPSPALAAPRRRGRPGKLTKAYIEQHAMPGESWENAAERLRLDALNHPENRGETP